LVDFAFRIEILLGMHAICSHVSPFIATALAQFTQQGPKLVGSGAVGFAEQGYSVSISEDGNTAIIGGLSDDSSIGAAWVFTRSGGVWTQQGSKLVGTGAVGNGYQGISVALSGEQRWRGPTKPATCPRLSSQPDGRTPDVIEPYRCLYRSDLAGVGGCRPAARETAPIMHARHGQLPDLYGTGHHVGPFVHGREPTFYRRHNCCSV
jgi:hypothetical protein